MYPLSVWELMKTFESSEKWSFANKIQSIWTSKLLNVIHKMIAQGVAVSETDAKNHFLLLHVVHHGPAMGTEVWQVFANIYVG